MHILLVLKAFAFTFLLSLSFKRNQPKEICWQNFIYFCNYIKKNVSTFKSKSKRKSWKSYSNTVRITFWFTIYFLYLFFLVYHQKLKQIFNLHLIWKNIWMIWKKKFFKLIIHIEVFIFLQQKVYFHRLRSRARKLQKRRNKQRNFLKIFIKNLLRFLLLQLTFINVNVIG